MALKHLCNVEGEVEPVIEIPSNNKESANRGAYFRGEVIEGSTFKGGKLGAKIPGRGGESRGEYL